MFTFAELIPEKLSAIFVHVAIVRTTNGSSDQWFVFAKESIHAIAHELLWIERRATCCIAVEFCKRVDEHLFGMLGSPASGTTAIGAFPLVSDDIGDPIDCTGSCTRYPGFGMVARGRGGYRFPSGFLLGIDVGYLYARQAVAGRATNISPTGLLENPGTVDDTLSLNGVLLGVSAGIKFGKKIPLRIGLGAGVFLGRVKDRRKGEFFTCAGVEDTGTCAPETSYSVDKTQEFALTAVHVAPEVKLVFPIRKQIELSAGIEGFLLLPMGQPTWMTEKSLVNTGTPTTTDGQGTFPEQLLLGRAVVGVHIGFGARYEF